MKKINIIRTIIFLLIGIISVMLLILIFSAYGKYWNNVDEGLGILLFSLLNILLGIVRMLISLKTNLPILFRIQDFLYSLITISILFRVIPFVTLYNDTISMLGQIAAIICLVCSVCWSIRISIWKY